MDDPILVIPNSAPEVPHGGKAKAGRAVEWIGAHLAIGPGRTVRVSIPREKLETLGAAEFSVAYKVRRVP